MYKDKDKQRATTRERVRRFRAKNKVYEPKVGYLYIIHCVGFPYYKIGQTVTPKVRLDTLRTSVPFELVLEYALKVNDMDRVEHKIQQQYEDKCIRGEWFMLTDQELELVKENMIRYNIASPVTPSVTPLTKERQISLKGFNA